MTLRKAGRFLFLLLAGCFALSARLAVSAVLVVDDDGQASATNCNAATPAHTTIGAAISAASNGDEIVVCPGTYFERINFAGKSITVRSRDGAAVTTIDGGGAGHVVTFITAETRQSRLEGFTIRNGVTQTPTAGGGIRISQASPSIVGNVIRDNVACTGAGISSSFGSPLIQGNTITQNSQDPGCSTGGGGGGMEIGGAGAAEIIGNVISNNSMPSAGSGGGISLNAAGTPIIRNNVISGNSAGVGFSPCSRGGGISVVNQTNAEIIQNIITGNTAGCGGGIAWLVPSSARGPRLVNNTIADNNATRSGSTVQTASEIHAEGFQGQVELINNILVARASQTAIHCSGTFNPNPPQFRSNDIFSPSGAAYGGVCGNPTGTNGNISIDPMFVNPGAGNFHLQAGSPAIDVGDNSAIGAPQINDNVWALITPLDIDGDPRVMNGGGSFIVDMGADEVLGEKPAARCFGSSAIYDEATDRLVVHSGAACAGGHPDDTWALTNGNGVGGPAHWLKVAAGGPATHNHSAVYDTANNRMIVFGGCLGSCLPIQTNVFVLTNANGSGSASWSALSPTGTPAGRQGHKAFYDPGSNRMIVWGGQDGGGSAASQFREVWVLTNANGLGGPSAWSQVATSGGLPEAAYFSAAVYDATNNRLVVFGGIDPSGVESNGVWVLSNANGLGGAAMWTNTVARNAPGSPAPRAGAQAVYHPTLNTMVIFDGGPAGDVWRLTNANGLNGPSVWSQISVAGGPGGSRVPYNAGAYDPATDAMIVFANNAAGNGNEAWVLRARGAPLDTIAPTTTASAAPAPNAAGWNNGAVTVTLSATDNAGGSGVKSITYTVNGGPATTVNAATTSFTLAAQGTHTVLYRAADNAGNVEADRTLVVRIDTAAPVTTAATSPVANAAGWNNSDVTVTLSAADTGGSGVQGISYTVTSGSSTTGASVNGASASIALTAEGTHSISYSALDVAGNVEASKTIVVRIDKTPPSGTLGLSPDLLWPPNHRMVTISRSLLPSDNLSGVASVSAATVTSSEPVDGLGDGDTAPDWLVSSSALQLRAERAGGGSGRVYTVTYTITDAAGNTAQVSATVVVPHDRRP